MLIVLGMKRYGRIDDVPNQVHVATMFFHILFIPLIPAQSQIVIDGGQYADKGIALAKLRWGSVLMAWLRLFLVLGTLGALFVGGLFYDNAYYMRVETGLDLGPIGGAGLFAAVAAVLVALMIASYRFTRATPQRAAALRASAGLA